MSAGGSEGSAGGDAAPAGELQDPGLARDRTALAWTRSSLNMAASGTLIVRAAFTARLDVLAVASAVAAGLLAGLTWRHGRVIYFGRQTAGEFTRPQTRAILLLTGATLVIAIVAIVVTIAI